ncbi:hypothetical protein [Phorcysia thermohydrogeniphila]|uniref:Uncharacterized protein n=1 Tax=Phorcysia thermohydrogeniphila TaxID=936138 RepID=A0A4R1GQ31_9BACT|nr:hypothetical protein [Phorcysia thermohydrogeniphila]TCK06622.1 hypothetical protein CLV27_0425 [Phorcysia thermohydrogeniphila]
MNLIKNSELPHYTYEDYKHWEGKWELIEGIPYAMCPPLLGNIRQLVVE